MLAPVLSACTISLTPPAAPDTWRRAAESLRDELRETAEPTDCGAVTIDVAPDGARVVFTTRDGRQTVRVVQAPDEVRPVVEALLVTLPPASGPSAALTPVRDKPQAPNTPDRTGDRSKTASVVFRAAVGGRLSTPGSFASPAVNAGAGAVVGSWELAVQASWDPDQSAMARATPSGFAMSRYAIGVAVGRRLPLGAASIALGLNTSVAEISESAGEGDTPKNVQGQVSDGEVGGATAMEPLAGLFTALVYPPLSSLRFRSELSSELVVSRLGRTVAIGPGLPALPWWDLALSLGVEWEPP